MKERIKKYAFPVCGFLLSLIISLFWVALRVNHSGISKFLGADNNPSFLIMNLPVMLCVLAWIGFALAAVGLVLWHKKKWPAITGFAIGMLMTVAAVVVVVGLSFIKLTPEPQPTLAELLATASPETLREVAEMNFDDIIFNQQI